MTSVTRPTNNNPLLPFSFKEEKHLGEHKVPFGQNPLSGQKASPCAAETSPITAGRIKIGAERHGGAAKRSCC